jgi:hypothetical protein
MDILKNCKTSKFVKNVLKGGHPGQLKRRFFKNDKNYVISTFLGDFPMLRSFCFCKKMLCFESKNALFHPYFLRKYFLNIGSGSEMSDSVAMVTTFWGQQWANDDGDHFLPISRWSCQAYPCSAWSPDLVLPASAQLRRKGRRGETCIVLLAWNWTKKKTFFLRKWFFLPLSLCAFSDLQLN